jgi:hypothetical protein
MSTSITAIPEYLATLTSDEQAVVNKIYNILKKNLPKGFTPIMQYGMISFVVPHKLYPAGYHCKPSEPLPFVGLASRKNMVSIYHMGIYASKDLLQWFTKAYEDLQIGKLDMGKSCIRFKKPEKIPYQLLAELCKKITVEDWISLYEKNYIKKK